MLAKRGVGELQAAACHQSTSRCHRPSTHTPGDCYLPEVRHGSDSDRVTALPQNTLSLDSESTQTRQNSCTGQMGPWALTNPYRNPRDPGKPAPDWVASLLMTSTSMLSRSLQVFGHPFSISENTETTSILVN